MRQLRAFVRPHAAAILAAAAVLIVATRVPHVFAQAGMPEPGMRTASPPFTVQTIGGELRIETLRGKVVLLDFMTTTCPACRQASHGIQKVYAELGFRGFQPLGVALNAVSAVDLFTYATAQALTFQVGTAPRRAILGFLQHPADRPLLVPTLVLLDRQGGMCGVETGWQGDEALRAKVLKLLSEPTPRDRKR